MNCEQVRESISGFVDGSLSSILNQAINNHLKRCENCSRVSDQEALLVEQLASSRIPEPRKNFYTQVLRTAREHHQGTTLSDIPFRFTSAAAFILVGILLTVAFQRGGFGVFLKDRELSSLDAQFNQGVELIVVEDKQLDIHLQLSVKKDINDATVVIEVPSSLALVGFESVNVLEWQVALKKGKNVLAIPVKARGHFTEDQVSYLVARVKTATQQKNVDIKVTIKSSGNKRLGALLNPPKITVPVTRHFGEGELYRFVSSTAIGVADAVVSRGV